jgi:hypothetical protein
MSEPDSLRPQKWAFRADIPQRYNGNAHLYRERGGQVRLEEDAQPFAADGNYGDASRIFFFCLMQDQILKEGLPGEIAELGVYKGMTAAVLARIARRAGRTLHLFDTFEGFSRKDLVGIDADKRLEQFTDTSLETVRARVGTENVRYLQGRFPESTRQVADDLRFCLVHIDCDLYEPITAALHYFYPRMVPGGFMVIHDYSSLAWNGAERAVDEFFADRPEYVVPLTDGAGSAVVRRGSLPEPKSALPLETWLKGDDPVLADALRAGWSKPESWGVWGVGESHTLTLPCPPDAASPLHVDVDCSAALVGSFVQQDVRVVVGEAGHESVIDTWRFTRDENRNVRTIAIPAAGRPTVSVTFHPAVAVRPSEHDPANSDNRALGVALYRVRIRR